MLLSQPLRIESTDLSNPRLEVMIVDTPLSVPIRTTRSSSKSLVMDCLSIPILSSLTFPTFSALPEDKVDAVWVLTHDILLRSVLSLVSVCIREDVNQTCRFLKTKFFNPAYVHLQITRSSLHTTQVFDRRLDHVTCKLCGICRPLLPNRAESFLENHLNTQRVIDTGYDSSSHANNMSCRQSARRGTDCPIRLCARSLRFWCSRRLSIHEPRLVSHRVFEGVGQPCPLPRLHRSE